MSAGRYDLIIEKGATLERTITWRDAAGDPVDLTGYAARLQVRETVASVTPMLDMDAAAKGGITLGGAAGTVALLVSAAATGALSSSRGVYDLELENGAGVVTRLLEGQVTIKEEVTR